MKSPFSKFLLAAIVVNGFAASARADALDSWKTNQVFAHTNLTNPRGNALLGVAYGNDRFIAAGEFITSDVGFNEISSDGVNWSLGSLSMLDLFDVTYGNGVFIAVGYDAYTGNNIYSSTNGINWTPHTTQISHIYRVISGNGLFVAVGNGDLIAGGTTNRQIYTSPDGITWTPRNSGAPASAVHPIFDIAYSGSQFVAIDDSKNSYTSSLGTSWIRYANSISNFTSINFCNDRFIAAASYNPVTRNGDPPIGYRLNHTNLVSFDGLSWSGMVKDTTNVFSRVIFSNGLYIGLSATSIFTSTNATNWVQRNFQVSTNTFLTGLAFGKSNLVVVGCQVFPKGISDFTYSNTTFVSDTFLSHNLTAGFPPQIKINGLIGRTYRIDCSTNLQSNNWQAIATFTLTNSPWVWTDVNATNLLRYYRTVLLP